jgi:hypothetical protein
MDMTLEQFLKELSLIKIDPISRNANGLLKALENSNRKDFLSIVISI